MGRDFLLRAARALDIGESQSGFGRSLLEVRYRALQRQIPLLYLIALANFIGLHLVVDAGGINRLTHPVNLVIAFVVLRLGHWVRTRGRTLPPERIVTELFKTYAFAAAFSGLFCYWAIRLFAVGDPGQQNYIILFASLAAIGCAYGLSSFPSAARLPLVLFALPLATTLVLSSRPGHVAVGISLGLITLLVLRLLDVQNHGFTRLVRSRFEVEAERERAQAAEVRALAEKARVREVADTDPLTGLANRRAFLARLEIVAAEDRSRPVTLAMVDLDGFKPINDTFGHATGDAVLLEVGERLRKAGGPGSLAARMGGDEFALLVPSCASPAAAARLGTRVSFELRRPYQVEGREFRLSGGCGLLLIEPDEHDLTLAFGRCDTALYSAKQRGRGEFALFTAEMEIVTRRRAAIERGLRSPGVHEQVHLVYQPIWDLETGGIHSFEALARWDHPELGPVPPGEFIPISEQINVVEAIGATLLGLGAAEALHWPDAIRLSFNLSAVQLCSTTAAARILAAADAASLDPARLQFEVTETALLVDFDSARRNLRLLRQAGARIVLDDFGAGFASLSYLREIEFDSIKLDGALVVSGAQSASGMRLLRGVVQLCASLGVPCVAEHIETKEQLALLKQLNCRYGQGFLLSPPLAAAEARALARPRVLPIVRGAAAA
jgi:diguanylate cyclase (GGDEF)-like protein